MKARCLNPKSPNFHNYGGRGIRVHGPWIQSFKVFLNDVGRRPSRDHTIDRIDNDGHYEPGNVKWSTGVEQGERRRDNRTLTFCGETLTLIQWARRIGISHACLSMRLYRGDSVERALRVRIY